MKATIAYYMLILYATVMFKPLIPIVQDFLSHTFSEAIHIATVHAIYGSNHLQKELSQQEKESNRPASLNGEITAQVHVPASELQFNFDLYNISSNYPANKADALMPSSLSKISPPPKNS